MHSYDIIIILDITGDYVFVSFFDEMPDQKSSASSFITLKKYIRKADIILFIILVVAGLAASAALSLAKGGAGAGTKVVIESGGKLYASYSLSEDRSIVVPAPKASKTDRPDSADQGSEGPSSAQYDYYNLVTISDGSVKVSEASCKNQVCVKHSAISSAGESIVCLPNRLVVSIEGDREGGGYDTITS